MITPSAPATTDQVAAHYDVLDRWYRSVWGEHVHHGLFAGGRPEDPETAARRLVSHVADLAGIRAGATVVDVGCGYGATGRQLAQEHGAQVTGYTLSRAQADYASSREPAVEVRVSDWAANNLADESCDAVLAIESLSHMRDKPGAFAHCARVLRPGGRLVVCDWLARGERSGWRDRLLLEPICREGHLPSMHTAQEYATLIEGAGLKFRSFEDRSRQVSRTWTTCLAAGFGQVVRDPQLRRFLVAGRSPDRVFAWTMLRILCAYGTRAMVYGTFVAERPGGRPVAEPA